MGSGAGCPKKRIASSRVNPASSVASRKAAWLSAFLISRWRPPADPAAGPKWRWIAPRSLDLDGLVGVADHRLEGRDDVADHVFRRIVQEHGEPPCAGQSGWRLPRSPRPGGVLRHREDVVPDRLPVPARDAGEAVGDVLELDVKRRRVEEVEAPAEEHPARRGGSLAISVARRGWRTPYGGTPAWWSLTIPTACMKAYTIVGPTKLNPSASAPSRSGTRLVSAWISARLRRFSGSGRPSTSPTGNARIPRPPGWGARPGARDRRFDLGPVSHDAGIEHQGLDLASSKRAITAGSNPAKARRKLSRFRRMVIQDNPAWKPSRTSFSNRARSSYSGTPHSVSWYST